MPEPRPPLHLVPDGPPPWDMAVFPTAGDGSSLCDYCGERVYALEPLISTLPPDAVQENGNVGELLFHARCAAALGAQLVDVGTTFITELRAAGCLPDGPARWRPPEPQSQ